MRAQYSGSSDYQIGINRLTSSEPLWYTLDDCAASKLRTGKAPQIIRAIRFVPVGKQRGLRPVQLGGQVTIDPATDDFFKRVIELRKSLPADMPEALRKVMDQFLKILANSTSYGIFVELNRQENKESEVEVFTGEPKCFINKVKDPEEPGDFFFPPLATLITGGARLMLALLEHAVREKGGVHAFCDTDSLAIVSSELGGLIACDSGPERLPDGTPGVRALSWADVREIVGLFESLKPYDASVPDTVLKIENVNFDATSNQRQLYTFSISAKRYALFTLDKVGGPTIVAAKAHGLGHVLPPDEPVKLSLDDEEDGDDPEWGKLKPWMRGEWEAIVRESLGLPIQRQAAIDRIAVSRLSVRKPPILRALRHYNETRSYADRIKPFSFHIGAQVSPLGHPPGTNPARFRLVHPFETDPRKRQQGLWTNIHDGKTYRVSSAHGEHVKPDSVSVQSYADLLEEYRFHPESKSGDTDGRPAGRPTVGLLSLLRIRATEVRHIGKESNRLDDVEEGLVEDAESVYLTYFNAGKILEGARNLATAIGHAALAEFSGLSEFGLRKLLQGKSQAHRNTVARLHLALLRLECLIPRD